MTDEQFAKLAQIQTRLMDVFVMEADPDNWPGAGKIDADMDRNERGDRKWAKQNASATLVLLMHSQRMIDERNAIKRGSQLIEQPADEMEEDVAKFERQANKVIEKALGRA
jgi:hypothetical protein